MPEYDIHVRCLYCDNEHPLLIKVFLGPIANRALVNRLLDETYRRRFLLLEITGRFAQNW